MVIVSSINAGKFGASAAGSVIFIHTSELYPSEIRGTAMGLCALFGRIGGIAAPQVIENQPHIGM